eukprot:4095778-Amphidinium_carterae.1
MTKVRTCARKALGKGAGLRRSAPLELMAHGGPAADPQVSADLLSECGIAESWRGRWSGLCRITCGTTPLDLVVVEARCATLSNLR